MPPRSRLGKFCINCGTVTDGLTRCDDCRRAVMRHRMRTSPSARVYSSPRWRALRDRAIRLQPWCEYCGATADLTGDHRVPLSRGGPAFPRIEDGGIRVACRRCNASRKDKGDDWTGPPPGGWTA